MGNWFHEQAGKTYPVICVLKYIPVGKDGVNSALFSAEVETTCDPDDFFRISLIGSSIGDCELPRQNLSLVNAALDCLCGDARGNYETFREQLPEEVAKEIADPLQETFLRLRGSGE